MITKKTQKKNKDGETPLDIVSLNPDKAITESESTLEYVILSLCQALSIIPK